MTSKLLVSFWLENAIMIKSYVLGQSPFYLLWPTKRKILSYLLWRYQVMKIHQIMGGPCYVNWSTIGSLTQNILSDSLDSNNGWRRLSSWLSLYVLSISFAVDKLVVCRLSYSPMMFCLYEISLSLPVHNKCWWLVGVDRSGVKFLWLWLSFNMNGWFYV